MLTSTLQRPLVVIISTMLTNHYYELGLKKQKPICLNAMIP